MSKNTAHVNSWRDLEHLTAEKWASAFTSLLQRLDDTGQDLADLRDPAILTIGSIILEKGTRDQKFAVLEAAWHPGFSNLIHELHLTSEWFEIQHTLIQQLNYTFGELFLRRARVHPNRVLFQYYQRPEWRSVTWQETLDEARRIQAGIESLQAGSRGKVATLSENRVEVAFVDIACLVSGIENVPIQPQSTAAQIGYILNHAEIEVVFASSRQQLGVLESLASSAPHLKHIVLFDESVFTSNPMVVRLKDFEGAGQEDTRLEKLSASVSLDSMASIMYTSGTTGYPKGIRFTHENLVTKRFARSLVLPLGSEDVFLAYLPLFHTFGRFLELWGAIFWGARYVFARGTGNHSLTSDLLEVHPTVLISIPKRWQEIYERVQARIDPETDTREAIQATVQHAVGGKLRWGLSAAGYLDPEIFQFFQRNGVYLHSGYGMTEATGGITMTPRDAYIPDSVGRALPGIEIALSPDGEMQIRGPYVSPGYWNDEDEDIRESGWFRTGDVFRALPGDQYQIVDRKKEIYKNVKGQTIAPQKIENMFREFDSILQVFVVGDHRPYNTALMVLKADHPVIEKLAADEQRIEDYISSLINSVNSFLAPFERILSFAILDEPFSEQREEITPKGTFKRQKIQENYSESIEELYVRTYQSYYIADTEMRIPNWFFRYRGWTQRDLKTTREGLVHVNGRDKLDIGLDGDTLKLGLASYKFDGGFLDFDTLLHEPAIWIGNPPLEAFIQPDRLRSNPSPGFPIWLPASWQPLQFTASERQDLEKSVDYSLKQRAFTLENIAAAIRLMYTGELSTDHVAYQYLARAQRKVDEPLRSVIAFAYLRMVHCTELSTVRHVVLQLMSMLSLVDFERAIPLMLSVQDVVPQRETVEWPNIAPQKVDILRKQFARACQNIETTGIDALALNLMNTLIGLSQRFPTFYTTMRRLFARCSMSTRSGSEWDRVLGEANQYLASQFKTIMGLPGTQILATTHDMTFEWEDVLAFDPVVPIEHRDRIRRAFEDTSLLNETLFICHQGMKFNLADVPPEGIWVSPLGESHGKAVYRVTIRNRDLRTYKFALNVNDTLAPEEIAHELHWLVACGHDDSNLQIVERLGGTVDADQLWSEEFIPGHTVSQYLKLAEWGELQPEQPAAEYVWPHFAWTGIYTYATLWQRTGYNAMLSEPNAHRLIIPIHDYHVGGRIVSLSGMQSCQRPVEFLELIQQHFLDETQNAYPGLELTLDPDIIFMAIYEALGPVEARPLLNKLFDDPKLSKIVRRQLETFLKSREEQGHIPKSVYFASRRYHRWLTLNTEATLKAKAGFLKNLYHDYKVQQTETTYPDARVRLFLDTVFHEGKKEIRQLLMDLMDDLRAHRMDGNALQNEIGQYTQSGTLSEDDSMLLKRIAFPELPPSDQIDLIATRSTALEDVEIMISRRDQLGQSYRIRRAMTPKEIINLQQLFVKVNLPVSFNEADEYLVAINENSRVIGGLFYRVEAESAVYLDKIVVSNNYRGRGISRGLIEEFLNRMRNRGYRIIITGFLHPGFFYKFGFQLESNQAGLVKYL